MVEARQSAQQGRAQPAHGLEENRIHLLFGLSRHPAKLSQSGAMNWTSAMAGSFVWVMLPAQSSDAGFKSTGAASAEITRKEPR